MRRAPARGDSFARYLGRIAGHGSVRAGGETIAQASYDFDGFASSRGGVTSSGELSLTVSDLKAVFGRPGVQLVTEDGRVLDLIFSETALSPGADVAHVDVTGDLPRSPDEWRAASTTDPI